ATQLRSPNISLRSPATQAAAGRSLAGARSLASRAVVRQRPHRAPAGSLEASDMTYTPPDEYSAQLQEVEAAEEIEEELHGRPYEIAAVREGGLFRELVRDRLG